MGKRFAILAALVGTVVACSGAGTQATVVPVPDSTTTAATVAPATAVPTLAATQAPTAAAAETCIISKPQQIGTDMTPVVIQYDGITQAQCQQYLAVAADATDFEKEHPSTLLTAAPTDTPKCTKTLAGTTVTVWGAGAADFLCSALQLASPQP